MRGTHFTIVRGLFAGAMVGLLALMTAGVTPPDEEQLRAAFIAENAQMLSVSPAVEVPEITRDAYGATPGYETFIEGGTNHDWASLVLLMGDFPLTEDNVTVLTRWMRQENYVDAWWTRNNPLNNGWGSGGGGGTGSYATLVDAARNAAEALRSLPRYSEIVATLDRQAPTEEIERAIWFSGWATGMYNGGSHWSYTEVPELKAPPAAWGR